MTNEQSEPNIFRDSLLRYAGYANEVGESFRYQVPRFVVPSYAIAFGYVICDAGSSGWSTYQRTDDVHRAHDTLRATVDTLLWQSLASVMIPGATINLIVRASRLAVQRAALPVLAAQWTPTVVGLSSIPFIVQPIDLSVDYMLDNSTRGWWKERSEYKKL
jgi:fission process protein 1